jgi:hypothetical protein
LTALVLATPAAAEQVGEIPTDWTGKKKATAWPEASFPLQNFLRTTGRS